MGSIREWLEEEVGLFSAQILVSGFTHLNLTLAMGDLVFADF